MTELLSQFRVDNVDRDRAIRILTKFLKKHPAKYLIVEEIAEESRKLHLQGWVLHDLSDNTFRVHFARQYKELGTKQKCFSPVNEGLKIWASYILNNDMKTDVQYSDCITNYTAEEFAEFKTYPRRLKLEEFLKQSRKTKKYDWYQDLFDRVEQACIDNNNYIDYSGAVVLYLDNPPKMTNRHSMFNTLNSIFIKLENKYTKNSRAKSRMIHGVAELGEGLFDPVQVYSKDT